METNDGIIGYNVVNGGGSPSVEGRCWLECRGEAGAASSHHGDNGGRGFAVEVEVVVDKARRVSWPTTHIKTQDP